MIAAASSVEDAEVAVSRWSKFFSTTETFAKYTGLFASIAGCVLVGFQIYNDFDSDAPVALKVLDICQVCF